MASATEILRTAARVVAATAGTYAVSAAAAALIAVLLIGLADLSRSDALLIGSMVAYLLFAGLMLWCFAERRLLRVWLILFMATAIAQGLALLIEPTLPVSFPVEGATAR